MPIDRLGRTRDGMPVRTDVEVPMVPEMAHRQSPLIITGDPVLLEDLLRLTADVHLIADVAPDPAAARNWFAHAPLVLVGIDMAEACARAGLRRRTDLVVVGRVADVDRPPDWDVAERLGANHVAALPAAEPWLAAQLARIDAGAIGDVIAVLGGRGGAGASVLAGALAVTGARHGKATMLVDADPLGGGVDLVLGWEHRDGLRWPALAGIGGRVRSTALVESLPGRTDLVVLSWDRGEPTVATPEAMIAALDAGRRGRDLVVIDLPRCLDDAATLALANADRTYLVVPAELRACAAAARVAATALPHSPGLSVVVRQPAPGGLTATEVAAAVGLPLAGSFRRESAISAALERGEPPASSGRGSLARLCDRLLAERGRRVARVAA
jgi:secretion/DNA translocation related CpaE-like protein